LDRYRIQALAKLLQKEPLSPEQQALVLQAIGRKCRIYSEGCRKRGRTEEAEFFQRLPQKLAEEAT
jgi:hypothetical protein